MLSLGALYISIASLLMMRLLWMQRTARRHLRSAARMTSPAWTALLGDCGRQLNVSRLPDLLMDPLAVVPMTLGSRRPVIVLPAAADEWSYERRRAVLLHELAHVARLDCLTQMLAGITCALYWMHPGAWWAAHRLKIEREFACDDLAVAAGCDRRDYATHLLELAYSVGRSRVSSPALAMASGSGLESRLTALLDINRQRRPPAWRTVAAAMPLMLMLFVAVGTAAIATDDQRAHPSAAGQRAISLPSARAWINYRVQRVLLWAETQLALLDELQRQHYARPTPLELMKLPTHGIDVDFVRDLDAVGYRADTAARLIEFADHGVTPDFIAEMNDAGLGLLSPEDLLRARRHGVDPDFVRELAALGYRGLALDQLVTIRRHGVDPDFVREMAAIGYPRLPLDQLIQLRRHGVDGDDARNANSRDGRLHSVPELIDLVSKGWTRP
jgi:beta-lactamase regulating signal transducer with metallopeptidase domain